MDFCLKIGRLQDEVGRLQDEVGRLRDEIGRLQDVKITQSGRLQDRICLKIKI